MSQTSIGIGNGNVLKRASCSTGQILAKIPRNSEIRVTLCQSESEQVVSEDFVVQSDI